MNKRHKLEKIIQQIVVASIESDEVQIPVSGDLRDYGMNSINCIKIIVEVEDEFGFEFNVEDLILDNFRTINKIISYVESKISRDTDYV